MDSPANAKSNPEGVFRIETATEDDWPWIGRMRMTKELIPQASDEILLAND